MKVIKQPRRNLSNNDDHGQTLQKRQAGSSSQGTRNNDKRQEAELIFLTQPLHLKIIFPREILHNKDHFVRASFFQADTIVCKKNDLPAIVAKIF